MRRLLFLLVLMLPIPAAATTIIGSALDAGCGPSSAIRVELGGSGIGSADSGLPIPLASDGRFVIERAEPGLCTLGISAPGREYQEILLYFTSKGEGDTVSLEICFPGPIHYAPGSEWVGRIDSMELMVNRMYGRYQSIIGDAQKRYASAQEWYASRIATTVMDTLEPPVRDAVARIVRTDPDPRVRELAAARLMSLLPYDLAEAAPYVAIARGLLSPRSPAWEIAPRDILHYIGELSPENPMAYLQEVVENHPLAAIRTTVLLEWLDQELARDNDEKAREIYYHLMDRYGNDGNVLFHLSEMRRSFDSKHHIMTILPSFDLPRLDARGRIALGDLGAGVTLIDIWAPGCARCMGDIEMLREADSIYRGRPLRIVSIAVGGSEKEVCREVARQHMGWIQAFVPPARRAAFRDTFDIVDLPKRFLIDSTGEILATEFDVSRPMLIDRLDLEVGMVEGR